MNVGQQFSHYLIEEKIGEGGFGDVFRARDLNSGMEVAIKCSHPGDPERTNDKEQRFLREVSCISKLHHPNIVQLYDYGTLPDNTLFLVMEYVRGFNLEDLIKRDAPFGYVYASEVILQVLDALAEAHAHSIIHRDLKPANIMLVKQGLRNDVVKLLDFGIAKPIDGSMPDLTEVFEVKNLSFGTPQYMPPEQFNGKQLGPHSDLYSVGLIFFELITGKQAVSGKTLAEVVEKQLNGIIDIPEPFSLGPLGDIFRRALAKSVDMRYTSAAEMYQDIDAIMRQKSPFLALYSSATAPSRQVSVTFSPNTGFVRTMPNTGTVGESGPEDEMSTIDNKALEEMLSKGDNPVDLSGYKTVIFEDGFEGLPEIDESPNAYHPSLQVRSLPPDAPVLLPKPNAPEPNVPNAPRFSQPQMPSLPSALPPDAPVLLPQSNASAPSAPRFSQPQIPTVLPPDAPVLLPQSNASVPSAPNVPRFSQPQVSPVVHLKPTSPMLELSPDLPPTEIGDIIQEPPPFKDDMLPTNDVNLAGVGLNISSAATCPISVPNLQSRAPVSTDEANSGEIGIKTCAMPSYSEMLKERGEEENAATDDLPVVFHQQSTKFFTSRQLSRQRATLLDEDAAIPFSMRFSMLIDTLYEKHFLALVIGVCMFIILITLVLILFVMRSS